MKLLLFTGASCPKCPAAKKVVEEVTTELKMERGRDWDSLNIDEGDNMITALQYQVASTPAVIVYGELFSVGDVPDKEKLMDKLKE